jgi:succinoglycan biosynthesis transport protein ExoP
MKQSTSSSAISVSGRSAEGGPRELAARPLCLPIQNCISKDSRISGKLDFLEPAEIQGEVEGEITGGEIVITPTAVVTARITAATLTISGQVNGEIVARERIELLPTARLRCKIVTPTLVLTEGAQFDGDCRMPHGSYAERSVPALHTDMNTELSPYQISPSGPPPPLAYSPHEPNPFSSEINFKEYWRVIQRHRLMILSLVFAAAVITVVWRFTRTPQYQASLTILIQPQTPQVLSETQNFNEDKSNYSGDYDYYRTQFDLLKSESLAARVIQDYRLEANPLFHPAKQRTGLFASAIASVNNELAHLAGAQNDTFSAAGLDGAYGVAPAALKAYLARLTVEPVRGTRLVLVRFTTPDRELSARIANAHVQTYIRQGLELHAQTGKNVEEFLQVKLVELRDKVEKSEATLNAYRRSRGIVTLEADEQKAGVGDNPLIQRLTQLNSQLTQAASKRITLGTQHRMIARGGYDSLPEMISNPVIQNLKEQVAQLSMQYAAMSHRFHPGYHPLDDLRARLMASRRALNSESRNVAESVDADYRAAVANEAKIAEEIDRVKTQTLALNDASLQEAMLERQVNASRQLYRSVLERMNEISVAAEVPASNISVVDPAQLPLGPTGPRLLLLLAFSVACSSFVGIALAFFLESMDDSLKTGDELSRYLGLPSLGVIPDFVKLKDRGSQPYAYFPSRRRRAEAADSVAEVGGEKWEMLSQSPFSMAAEVYRAIRAAIMFSRAGGAPKSILITSSTANEGKTITAVNIATTFAKTGGRTILVDTDFRRARCHMIMDTDSEPGLSEILVRQSQLEDAVLVTEVPDLCFLPAGVLPPNPSELLASSEMRELIRRLVETYDYVVLDSAPVLPVSDSVALATMVEAALVVVDGDTSRRLVRETCLRLDHAGVRILGVLLNHVDVESNSHFFYDHYTYYDSYKPRRDPQTKDNRPNLAPRQPE